MISQLNHLCRHSIIILVLSLTLVSCGNDVLDESEPEKIEYYVKYESHMSINVSRNVYVNVVVDTEKGRQTLKVTRSWEGVFGPFNELKTMHISAYTDTGYNEATSSCRGRISICRGNQPFILKAEENRSGTSFSLDYRVTRKDLN